MLTICCNEKCMFTCTPVCECLLSMRVCTQGCVCMCVCHGFAYVGGWVSVRVCGDRRAYTIKGDEQLKE